MFVDWMIKGKLVILLKFMTYTRNQNSIIVKVATYNSTLHNDRIISRYNKTVNFNNSDLNTDIVNVSQIYTWGEMLYKEFGLDKTSITNDMLIY